MSKLNVDQKTIDELFSDKKADFLIPDYQRPYAWDEEQCQTLWDDIFLFSFPNNNYEDFDDDNEEYFLGSIVTYKNEKGPSEVIDGQQRLTTLMLLLRAFYDKFADMQDDNSKLTRERIEKCIWKTDTFGTANKSTLKINSEVATDNDKEEFLYLLRAGNVKQSSNSQYVLNYQFFQKKIEEFSQKFPSYFAYLPARILGNCILLPIEAESQDTALRIFSTLNDRGLPLSDADIFKAQFYKYYAGHNKTDKFIGEWKNLEEISNSVFDTNDKPMDELFTRYMYFLRAKEGNKSTTTEALRKFYEREKYKYLKKDNTIEELEALALFWKSVSCQNKEQFSNDILKKFFVLKYAPNSMWQNITSVYFLQHRNTDGKLEETKFSAFLSKITAFIFAYTVTNPGVNALRTPVYDEMVRIVSGDNVTFFSHKFNDTHIRASFENYTFTNQRNITRSIITWYAYTFSEQQLLDSNEAFDLEHIYSKKRQEMESDLQSEINLEALGNKVLLEKSINISASDYRFEDKRKIYSGEERRGKNKDASKIAEIVNLSEYKAFGEKQIVDRTNLILNSFFDFLRREDLISKNN